MRRLALVCCAGLTIGWLAGCDAKKETNPAPNTPAAPSQEPKAQEPNQDKVQSLLNAAKSDGQTAYNMAKDKAGELANSATVKEISAKLDQAVQYAQQRKPEVADRILTELEKHKSSLPQSIQDRLTDVRKQVDAQKVDQAKPTPQ
jgi:hypothetical protein